MTPAKDLVNGLGQRGFRFIAHPDDSVSVSVPAGQLDDLIRDMFHHRGSDIKRYVQDVAAGRVTVLPSHIDCFSCPEAVVVVRGRAKR